MDDPSYSEYLSRYGDDRPSLTKERVCLCTSIGQTPKSPGWGFAYKAQYPSIPLSPKYIHEEGHNNGKSETNTSV